MKRFSILFLNGEKIDTEGRNLLEALMNKGYKLNILSRIKEVIEL